MVGIFIVWWQVLALSVIVYGQARQPRITEHPSDTLVRKSEPATLNCKAEGRPPPTIEWYHDGNLVRDENKNRILLPSGSLFFLEVLRNKRDQDTGTYWCVATNELGQARSKNASLEIALIREDFRIVPKNVLTAMGDTATLECVPPKGYPEPYVRWKKDSEMVITNKGRIRMSPPGNLIISDVQQSDEGRYSCIAENIAGVKESPAVHVTVHVKPFFIKEPEHVTVLSNVDISFECRVGGDPQPTITWRRQDGKMPTGRSVIAENKSLQIKNVSPADDGIYVCEAKNPVGSISASVTLTVHSRPKFLTVPKDQKVNLNGIVKFDCSASGNPPPSIFWTKEGNQVLMFPERAYGRFSVDRDGTLLISSVRKEDKGYYICSVLSGIGSTMAKAFLDVTSAGDLPAPIIRLGPANQTLPLNTIAMMSCDVSGEPWPVIRWFFNSSPLNIDNPRTLILDSGTLQIEDLQTSDSGLYTCTASNENGETSSSASLSIESPRNPNAVFHRMPDPSAFPGAPSKPMILNVTETTVTLSWKRNLKIGSSSLIGYTVECYSSDLQSGWMVVANRISKENFIIQNLRPDTRYMFFIRAENSHGLSLPSPVSDVVRTTGFYPGMVNINLDEARNRLGSVVIFLQDVIPISSTAVKMLWKIQGPVSYIEGFYVRFRDLHGGSQKYNMVTVLNGGSSSYVLTELRKFSKYEFFLVPFYKSVEGPPSNSRTTQTLEDVPSASPENLHVKVIGPASASILWSPPPLQHRNGLIHGYIVKVIDDFSHLHSLITTNTTTTFITLTNLTAGAMYNIKVAAFTSSGAGPYSPVIQPKIDYTAVTILGKGPQSTSDTGINDIVGQPWFIALIGSIIFVLLSVFFVILFFKRRTAWKKGLQAHLSGPVLKAEDISRVGVSARETLWINQAWHTAPSMKNGIGDNKVITNMNTGTDHSYISGGTSDYAEVDTHNMTTFYKKEHPSVPAPYATTTLINPGLHSAGSIHEGKSSGSEASKRSDRMYDMEARLIEDCVTEQLVDARNMISPSSDSGSYTTDEYGLPIRRKRLKPGGKGSVVNWADLIPPPPEHPPSGAPSPSATPSTVRNQFQPRNNRSQIPLENVSSMSHSPLINRSIYTNGCVRQGSSSPWSTLTRLPVDVKRSPTPPVTTGPRLPPVNSPQTLPPTFGSNPLMDRGIQSSLVSLSSDPYTSRNPRQINQDKYPKLNQGVPYYRLQMDAKSQESGRYGSIFPTNRQDLNSADSSAAEDTDYAHGNAPGSSWTSATDRSNTSSVRSSVASSSEGSVYTDSDFVNAVTRAAQSAGLHLLSPTHPSKIDNISPSMSLLSPVHHC